jgi:hypothetical protein
MALKPSWFVPFVFHFTASWLTSLRKKHQKQHIIRKHPPTSSPDPLPQPTSSNHHTPTPTAASNTDGARIHDGTACQSQPVSIDLFTFWSSRHTHTVLEDRASLYVAYRVVITSLNSHAGLLRKLKVSICLSGLRLGNHSLGERQKERGTTWTGINIFDNKSNEPKHLNITASQGTSVQGFVLGHLHGIQCKEWSGLHHSCPNGIQCLEHQHHHRSLSHQE